MGKGDWAAATGVELLEGDVAGGMGVSEMDEGVEVGLLSSVWSGD